MKYTYKAKSALQAYNLKNVTCTKPTDDEGNITNWSVEHQCHFIVTFAKSVIDNKLHYFKEKREAITGGLLESETFTTFKALKASL
ncbi:MAG: hypothetical protein GY951_11710 [Psychromonas sp.]|nr:hypothetical protein [Psychromonas sp.]